MLHCSVLSWKGENVIGSPHGAGRHSARKKRVLGSGAKHDNDIFDAPGLAVSSCMFAKHDPVEPQRRGDALVFSALGASAFLGRCSVPEAMLGGLLEIVNRSGGVRVGRPSNSRGRSPPPQIPHPGTPGWRWGCWQKDRAGWERDACGMLPNDASTFGHNPGRDGPGGS